MISPVAHALFSIWLQIAAADLPAPGAGTDTTLTGLVREAERTGLPASMVANKIREGQAKRVAPERIATVARQMVSYLGEARTAATQAGRRTPSDPFFRAFVDARWAGAETAALKPLVDARLSEEASVQALQAVADLAARGYDVHHAVALVKQMASRDTQALARAAREIDALRRQYALTQNEVLERVESALTSSNGNLDKAVSQAQSGGAGKGGALGVGAGMEKGNSNSGKGVGLHPGAVNGKGMGMGMGQGRAKK